jgi:phage terminase small subunit
MAQQSPKKATGKPRKASHTRTGERIYNATGTTLTAKEQAFVKNYVQDPNGTQAAKLAGYSPNTAHVIANENLKKPKVKREIQRLFDEHVLAIHKRNMAQRSHLPTSQTAVRDYYKVTGHLEETGNTTVAIQFNVEQ